MLKLTKRVIRFAQTYVRTGVGRSDPNYRKASLLKTLNKLASKGRYIFFLFFKFRTFNVKVQYFNDKQICSSIQDEQQTYYQG